MRITSLPSGTPFQLAPQTVLEIERTNPFFADYGEQSLPVTLPDSPHNRRLLRLPDRLGANLRQAPLQATIEDGEYFAQARQAVLTAQQGAGIATAFYLNEGAFYATLQNVTLADIFQGETVPGVTTVNEAIQFCRSLVPGTDERFAIFPVALKDDSDTDADHLSHKILNAYGYVTPDTSGRTDWDFYNAVERTEYVKGVKITLSPGFYISPFVRAHYVLRRIFAHFGYTLLPSFLTTEPAFRSMVFLNNVIDAIVNGVIALPQILPAVNATDVLDFYRRLCCIEFIPDEVSRTVTVTSLADVLAQIPAADISDRLTAKPIIHYNAASDYQRVVLSMKETITDDTETATDTDGNTVNAQTDDQEPESFVAMVNATPDVIFRQGDFYRQGFSLSGEKYVRIASGNLAFDTGGPKKEYKVEIPAAIPPMAAVSKIYSGGFSSSSPEFVIPYVGEYRTLNSSVKYSAATDAQTTANTASLPVVPCFCRYVDPESSNTPFTLGTTSERVPADGFPPVPKAYIADLPGFTASLAFYGPAGIYERFYRPLDALLRNSMNEVEAEVLLTQSQKMALPAHRLLAFSGQQFFVKSLKFAVGDSEQPLKATFYTTRLFPTQEGTLDVVAPWAQFLASNATPVAEWKLAYNPTAITEEEYLAAADKDRIPATVFPPLPAKERIGQSIPLQTTALQILRGKTQPLHDQAFPAYFLDFVFTTVATYPPPEVVRTLKAMGLGAGDCFRLSPTLTCVAKS